MEIIIMFVRDFMSEKDEVERGTCTFAVVERLATQGQSHATDYAFYISTKEDTEKLSQLPGWTLIMPGLINHISRFGVMGTRKSLLANFEAIYGTGNVLIKNS